MLTRPTSETRDEILQRKRCLVDLEHVSLVLLESLHLLLGLILGQALLDKGTNERLVNVRNGPGRTANEEVALLAFLDVVVVHQTVLEDDFGLTTCSLELLDLGAEVLGEQIAVLEDLVLDVDLLGRVTGEGETHVLDHAVLSVGFEFFTVKVLGGTVTRAEVVNERSDVDTLRLLVSTSLDEGSEGCSTRTETSHDDGLRIDGWQLHDRRLERDGHLGTRLKLREVARALSVTRAAAGRLPVNGDDEQVDRLTNGRLGRSDRVVTRLDGLDERKHLVNRQTSRGEHAQHIGLLERVRAFGGADEAQPASLVTVGGKLAELFVEALGGLTEDVEVLLQRLEDGAALVLAGLGEAGSVDNLVGIVASPLDKVGDFLLVVPAVDTERLADLVLEVGAPGAELHVEDVSVVVDGGEASVLGDLDHPGLLGQVGSKRVGLGVVGLGEEMLPSTLSPGAAEGGRLDTNGSSVRVWTEAVVADLSGTQRSVLLGFRDGLSARPLVVVEGVELDGALGGRDETLDAIDANGSGADDALEEGSKSSTRGVELDTQDSDEKHGSGDLGGDDIIADLGLATARVGCLGVELLDDGSGVDEQETGALLGEHALVLGAQLGVELSDLPAGRVEDDGAATDERLEGSVALERGGGVADDEHLGGVFFGGKNDGSIGGRLGTAREDDVGADDARGLEVVVAGQQTGVELGVGAAIADGASGELSKRSGGASLAVEEGDDGGTGKGQKVSVDVVCLVEHVVELERGIVAGTERLEELAELGSGQVLAGGEGEREDVRGDVGAGELGIKDSRDNVLVELTGDSTVCDLLENVQALDRFGKHLAEVGLIPVAQAANREEGNVVAHGRRQSDQDSASSLAVRTAGDDKDRLGLGRAGEEERLGNVDLLSLSGDVERADFATGKGTVEDVDDVLGRLVGILSKVDGLLAGGREENLERVAEGGGGREDRSVVVGDVELLIQFGRVGGSRYLQDKLGIVRAVVRGEGRGHGSEASGVGEGGDDLGGLGGGRASLGVEVADDGVAGTGAGLHGEDRRTALEPALVGGELSLLLAVGAKAAVGLALVAEDGGAVAVGDRVDGGGAGELGARDTEQPGLSSDLGSDLGLGGTLDSAQVHASLDMLGTVGGRGLRSGGIVGLSVDEAVELLATGGGIDAVGSDVAGQLRLGRSDGTRALCVDVVELLGSGRVDPTSASDASEGGGRVLCGDGGRSSLGGVGGAQLCVRHLALDRLVGLVCGGKGGTRERERTSADSETTGKDGSALVERLRRGGSHLECMCWCTRTQGLAKDTGWDAGERNEGKDGVRIWPPIHNGQLQHSSQVPTDTREGSSGPDCSQIFQIFHEPSKIIRKLGRQAPDIQFDKPAERSLPLAELSSCQTKIFLPGEDEQRWRNSSGRCPHREFCFWEMDPSLPSNRLF
ncbi:hypothetical protein PHBOTO_003836 [Pseudozyma hubeiensis]|nr:hypothetical protein PHBOTO_003836 [Pseudozyma hubeiensis]